MGEKIQAGDSYAIEYSYPLYAGYTVEKVFNNQSFNLKLTATETSAGEFAIVENAQVTNNWQPGDYRFSLFATLNNDRYTLETGKATVFPNLANGPVDQRGHVKKVLDALEAMLEGKATKDQASMSIAGRALARYEIEDLLKWRDKYKSELTNIDRMAGEAATTGKIYTRF